MARGFGTTYGAASTDRIQLSLTANNSLRSYAVWTYRNGSGGGGFGRLLDKFTADLDIERWYYDADTITYMRGWSGGAVFWNTSPAPTISEWHHVGVSYDSGSTTNDAQIYFDGVAQTMNDQTPSGSVTNSSEAYSIGNRGDDGARAWDGMLAEFAAWNAILTADEFAALGKGVSPLTIRPAALVEYVPMIGAANSWIAGATTVTGTAIQPHPRMHYPTHRRRTYAAPEMVAALPLRIVQSNLRW
jgi:hypothetical protein